MTSEMVASVIHRGRATLQELRTVYHLQDLYRLWEIDYVPMYNQWYDNERRKEKERLNQLAKSIRI
jgi:hypothetical protein